MTPNWVFLVLLPPLAVMLFGGRTAWMWLSLAAGVPVATGLLLFVVPQWAHGNVGALLGGFIPSDAEGSAYHDTYYVVANLNGLVFILVPAAILGALHLIRAHPRRHWIDIALFWVICALLLGARYWVPLWIAKGRMPRRYIDYPEAFQLWSTASTLAKGIAIAFVFIAAARPILSWWRARR